MRRAITEANRHVFDVASVHFNIVTKSDDFKPFQPVWKKPVMTPFWCGVCLHGDAPLDIQPWEVACLCMMVTLTPSGDQTARFSVDRCCSWTALSKKIGTTTFYLLLKVLTYSYSFSLWALPNPVAVCFVSVFFDL
jgi:hypothetical protein